MASPLRTRRDFSRLCLGAIAVGSSGLSRAPAADQSVPDRYRELASDRWLGPVQMLTKVEDEQVFTEGPAFSPQGDLYFTNVPASKILKWSFQQESLSTFRHPSHEANGLLFDPAGRLLACEGGARRVTRTDFVSGKIEVLAEGYQGRALAKPNDLCLDRQGRIYFTSRTSVEDPEGENPKGVYRIDPDRRLTRILSWPEVHMPNGIVISQDNRTLYLIEAHPDEGLHRDIRAYDLRPDGSLANGRVLINFSPGRSGDGMALGPDGNLYVAAGLHALRDTSETLDTRPGIHVISPRGKLLAYRETPEDTLTNCTFGGPDGRTLFVTCGTQLLAIQLA